MTLARQQRASGIAELRRKASDLERRVNQPGNKMGAVAGQNQRARNRAAEVVKTEISEKLFTIDWSHQPAQIRATLEHNAKIIDVVTDEIVEGWCKEIADIVQQDALRIAEANRQKELLSPAFYSDSFA